jgi:hypothetical protein
MKRVIMLEVTNGAEFTAEDIVTLAKVGANESCDDQFYELKVEVVNDSEVAVCTKCGKYMDEHVVWNGCAVEVVCPSTK